MTFGSAAGTFQPLGNLKGKSNMWTLTRNALMRALTNEQHRIRCPEIYLALFTRVHRVDPHSATIYNVLTEARARLTPGNSLHGSFLRNLQHPDWRQQAEDGYYGPTVQIYKAARAIGWDTTATADSITFTVRHPRAQTYN
eukprot:gene8399-19441_t